jgi:hypothetical protein
MAAGKDMSAPTLERKIHFYRIDAGKDAGGYPVLFDPLPALAKIDTLPFSNEKGRYLVGIDGSALCAWVDHQRERPAMRFGQIRRAGLPQIEELGELSDLHLAENAGLVEPVHVVFFPDNIAGVDFNFYGPRVKRLGHYLRLKAGDPTPLAHFEPLLRLDVLNQLEQLQDVRLFDLKIRPSFVEVVERADQDLGSAFQAARNLGHTEQIEILLRPAKDDRTTIETSPEGGIFSSKISLGRRLVNIAKTLARRDDLRTETKKFVIEGKRQDTDRVEAIDLLRDHLICHKQIVRHGERSRALDPLSAYAAIESAYGEVKHELLVAASIVQ